MVNGVGEDTCASLRCEHHQRAESVRLRTFELPFAYEEAGERKETLVKVRLCGRCGRKLSWKPEGEAEEHEERKEKNKHRSREKESDERRPKKRRE